MAKRSQKKKRPPAAAPTPSVQAVKAKPGLPWLQVIAIIAAGIWIYLPSLSGGWLWDDDILITNSGVVHDPDGLWRIWFHPGELFDYLPLKVSVEWFEWQLWGNHPLGNRIVNLILHVTNAFLVWRLLGKFGLKLAWLGGLIFVVHPVMVESVAWIAELKNTLSMPLFLCAICAYIDFDEGGNKRDYFLALGLFLAAMLCKATMVMFPFVILLYAWWKRDRIGWGDLKAAAPFLSVSLVIGVITVLFAADHARGEAQAPLDGFLPRLACAGLTLSFYFSKCILPLQLMPNYPMWHLTPLYVAEFLPWPILAGVLYALWSRRHSWGRHALLGVGFFLINLAPFIGFVSAPYMRFTWAMDHLLYIPIIGLIGLVVAGWEHLRTLLSPLARQTGAVAIVLALALMVQGSQAYAAVFSDDEGMWIYALKQNPGAWMAHYNLGHALAEKGQSDEAMAQFQESVRINPNYPDNYYNIGLLLFRTGRLPEAIALYQRALEIDPMDVKVYVNLGVTLTRQGKNSEAVELFQKAIQLDPDFVQARSNLGVTLTSLGNLADAEDQLVTALKIDPADPSALYNLGNVYFLTQRMPEAKVEYEASLKVYPNNASAHNNLGAVLERLGQIPEAITQFEMAAQIDPHNKNAHDNLIRLRGQQKSAPANP